MVAKKKYSKNRPHRKQQEEPLAKNLLQKASSGADRTMKIIIFLLGFLLYANSIPNEYALDDSLVITSNDFTRKGFGGISQLLTTDSFKGHFKDQTAYVAGGRYRPLSMITFALEWSLFGVSKGDKIDYKADDGNVYTAKITAFDKKDIFLQYRDSNGQQLSGKMNLERYLVDETILPYLSHGINAALYGLTGVLLYLLLVWCIPKKEGRLWWLQLPFVATALYLVHPLHVEIVANIKGRDEILALLLMLGCMFQSFRFVDTSRKIHLLWVGILFFLSMLAKESGLLFIVLIPLTIFFFKREKFGKGLMTVVPMLTAFVAYLGMRFGVAGLPSPFSGPEITEIMNDPFYGSSKGDKFATKMYTWGLYLKMLIWPHPLTHDYYPFQIPIVKMSDPRAFVPLLLHIGLFYAGIIGLIRRTILGYCIIFYFATFFLVSNLVFPIGTFMNDRFMYWPSIGFSLALGYLLIKLFERISETEQSFKVKMVVVCGLILLAFSAKTFTRTPVWKNNLILSGTDVQVSTNSAKAHMSAGLALIEKSRVQKDPAKEKEMLDKAVAHLTRSTELYSTYHHAWVLMGNAFYEYGDYTKAIDYYETCLDISNGYKDALNNLLFLALRSKEMEQYPESIRAWELLIDYKPDDPLNYKELGQLYGEKLGNPSKALEYLTLAYELSPKDFDIVQKLGVATGMLQRYEESLGWLQKALELQPDNAYIMLNMGITYINIGDSVTGQDYINKAVELDPNLNR